MSDKKDKHKSPEVIFISFIENDELNHTICFNEQDATEDDIDYILKSKADAEKEELIELINRLTSTRYTYLYDEELDDLHIDCEELLSKHQTK